jgi:hypothetical protein
MKKTLLKIPAALAAPVVLAVVLIALAALIACSNPSGRGR